MRSTKSINDSVKMMIDSETAIPHWNTFISVGRQSIWRNEWIVVEDLIVLAKIILEETNHEQACQNI